METTHSAARIFGALLAIFALVAMFLTGGGLLMAAALKNTSMANFILLHYPPYLSAMSGFETLKNLNIQLQSIKSIPRTLAFSQLTISAGKCY